MGRYNVPNMQSTVNVRLVVLGDRHVGKSALVVRYLTKRFIGEYASGSEFTYQKEVHLAGSKVMAEICDAVIKKDSHAHLRKLCCNSEACLLVYNVCNRSSFDYICNLAREITSCRIKSPSGRDVPMLIVGNKSDLGHFRQVDASEGENFAKSIAQCHFVETSAAESYLEVERAFKLIFQMVQTNTVRSSPPPNAGLTRSKRKNSLSQVAHLFREHYRKQHSTANPWNHHHTANSKTPEKEVISNFNEMLYYDNNNNTTKNAPVPRRIRKNSTLGFNYNPIPLGGKMRSRCLSLTTLNEDTANENANFSKNVLENSESKSIVTSQVESCWKPDDTKMSTSSDDTVELSDVSIPDEETFLSDHPYLASYKTANENLSRSQADAVKIQIETSPPQRKTSLNKKNLKIFIHSDNDCEDKTLSNHAVLPPKSAPAFRSSNGRFRFFSGNNDNSSFTNSPSAFSSSSSICSPQDVSLSQCLECPKEDKKSPTHNFLKHFFKGHLHNSFGVRSIGSHHTLGQSNQRSKYDASSVSTGDISKKALPVLIKRKSLEDHSRQTQAPKPRRSSTSISSVASNEEIEPEHAGSSPSPPSSPGISKNTSVKTRRSSIRETVEGLIRKRKASVANEPIITHIKERY